MSNDENAESRKAQARRWQAVIDRATGATDTELGWKGEKYDTPEGEAWRSGTEHGYLVGKAEERASVVES